MIVTIVAALNRGSTIEQNQNPEHFVFFLNAIADKKCTLTSKKVAFEKLVNHLRASVTKANLAQALATLTEDAHQMLPPGM